MARIIGGEDFSNGKVSIDETIYCVCGALHVEHVHEYDDHNDRHSKPYIQDTWTFSECDAREISEGNEGKVMFKVPSQVYSAIEVALRTGIIPDKITAPGYQP